MRILMYRWKAYNYRDIKENLIQMGHEVDEMSQELLNYDVDDEFAEKVAEKIRGGSYDFLFTVNYFGLLSNVCQREELLYVCWSCDSPLISMYHKSVFNDCNRIFLFDMSCCREYQEMGVEHVYYLPLAVDTNRLDYVISHVERPQMYSNDVAFVGSLYEKNSYDKMKYNMTEYLQGYFEATMEAQRDLQGVNIVERMLTPDILCELQQYFKLEKSEDSFSDLGLIFSTTTLGFKIAQLQRKSALLRLSKNYSVGLYTQSDVSDLVKVNYRGSVDYWSEMPVVFNQSKINLNMTIPNIKTGIPLRCFDVMGSGGFLLSNFQAEIPLHFEKDKELVCYYSEDDLIDKVDFYLKHEDERKRIAEAGYKKVKEEFNYPKVLSQMLEQIF